MHGSTKNIVLLLHDRAKMTSDTNRNRDTVILLALSRDAALHHGRSPHGLVDRRKRRHDFVTDGLDDSAVVLVSRVLHDVQADRDGLARLGIAEFVVQLGAADDVSEKNCNFEIPSHDRY